MESSKFPIPIIARGLINYKTNWKKDPSKTLQQNFFILAQEVMADPIVPEDPIQAEARRVAHYVITKWT